MRALISTWPRRLSLAVAIFALAFAVGALWLRYTNDSRAPDAPPVSDTSIMNTLFTLPGLLAGVALALSTVLASPANAAPSSTAEPAAKPIAVEPPPFKAQVVGVQWLNPLARRDYPTEWQLLWALGLAKPNKNDDMVKEDPKKFSTVQPVSAIASNYMDEDEHGNPKPYRSFYGSFRIYSDTLIEKFRDRYAMNQDYFYTIQPKSPKDWRELHGIHIELTLPDTPQLPLAKAVDHMRDSVGSYFEFKNPKLSTANTPADIHTTTGGANAGFTSLNAAMDYLQANPTKSVWVLSWDSPEYPNDESMSENATLLILAGPNMDTQREPLAWIARPALTHAKDFETKEGASKNYQAWDAALRQATKQADTTMGQIGYVIHDTGTGPAIGKRTASLSQALTMQNPELHFLEDGFNTPKLLGDMRAGSAVTNLALAIAWTHQKGKPVLVAGTTEPDAPVVVVVTPPARPRIANPDKNWFRARGEGNAYLPWWGLRKDYDWSKYSQGFSE